jgi:hypothetical protein
LMDCFIMVVMDCFIMVVMEIWKLLAIVIQIEEEIPKASNQEHDIYLFWPMQLFLGIAICNMLWHYQVQGLSIM